MSVSCFSPIASHELRLHSGAATTPASNARLFIAAGPKSDGSCSCNHPALIATDSQQAALEDYESKEQKLAKMIKQAVDCMGQAQYDKVRKRFADTAKEMSRAEKAGEEPSPTECPICLEPLDDVGGRVTKCGHEFCHGYGTTSFASDLLISFL